ncbi:hypothetical protein SELMODRAFT_439725 [Selaginella moellendorffii]|uniref:Bifunctional inhibitor/plant lipid transfer protein/seed storage helical domain-containing protein n=1 Tax=Selaginella moellendorffii TaxID=88036 RepID=D8R5D2_SELML|nr:uncharacterized protein LOC9652647 [Selaginella moellendorffii]EFJ32466.1 hypothetical protein SELMODRAFT_439725 [Selaginella moellendorffii]|eukprot:XP_002966439.1 uncharacterized protein LOC9652647 [Selaginella moellendorffii]
MASIKFVAAVLVLMVVAAAAMRDWNDSPRDRRRERECRQLRGQLQQCSRDSPSPQCCSVARQYVESKGCRPRDIGADLLQHCQQQQQQRGDDDDDQERRRYYNDDDDREVLDFIRGAWF